MSSSESVKERLFPIRRRGLLLSAVAVCLFWFALVGLSLTLDGPVSHPASSANLALGPKEGALRFAVVSRRGEHEREVALVVTAAGEDQFLPLKSALGALGEPVHPFGDAPSLVSNIDLAKARVRQLHAALSDAPTLGSAEVDLRPLLVRPTKVLHGAQSAGHYRNAKRASVRGQIPWINALVLLPFNMITRDGFYGVNRKRMPFDFFHGNNVGLYSTGDDVPLMHETQSLDIEAELGVVIGKAGRNIRPEDVDDYVAGFVVFNDFTDRREQMQEMSESMTGYQSSKYLTGVGPYLATDVDVRRFAVSVRVNGSEVLSASNDEIIDYMPFREQIAEYSKYFLAPGQIIALGTMQGGSFFELDLPLLRPGDQVELVGNQGLGTLRNRVVSADQVASPALLSPIPGHP